MSFRATALWRRHGLILVLGLLSLPVLAQAPNSPIGFNNQDAITTSFVPAPNMGGGEAASDVDNKWLKVEFHFGTNPDLPKEVKFIDAVEFKIWIEGRDMLDPTAQPGQGIAVGFTGAVTYINIPVGRDRYGVFYVHPSTLGRYCMTDPDQDFDRNFDIHLEAYVGGQLMDKIDKFKNKETDPNWFQQLKVIPGLVYRQDQCAFIVSSPDRYPAMKPSSSAP